MGWVLGAEYACVSGGCFCMGGRVQGVGGGNNLGNLRDPKLVLSAGCPASATTIKLILKLQAHSCIFHKHFPPPSPCPCCSQQVVDFVSSRLEQKESPIEIASELLNACMANDPREARG